MDFHFQEEVIDVLQSVQLLLSKTLLWSLFPHTSKAFLTVVLTTWLSPLCKRQISYRTSFSSPAHDDPGEAGSLLQRKESAYHSRIVAAGLQAALRSVLGDTMYLDERPHVGKVSVHGASMGEVLIHPLHELCEATESKGF